MNENKNNTIKKLSGMQLNFCFILLITLNQLVMIKIKDKNKKDLFVLNDKVYADTNYLRDSGVPAQTIKNGTYKFHKKHSQYWANIKLQSDKRITLIELKTIT